MESICNTERANRMQLDSRASKLDPRIQTKAARLKIRGTDQPLINSKTVRRKLERIPAVS
jgi:hypothetical protein